MELSQCRLDVVSAQFGKCAADRVTSRPGPPGPPADTASPHASPPCLPLSGHLRACSGVLWLLYPTATDKLIISQFWSSGVQNGCCGANIEALACLSSSLTYKDPYSRVHLDNLPISRVLTSSYMHDPLCCVREHSQRFRGLDVGSFGGGHPSACHRAQVNPSAPTLANQGGLEGLRLHMSFSPESTSCGWTLTAKKAPQWSGCVGRKRGPGLAVPMALSPEAMPRHRGFTRVMVPLQMRLCSFSGSRLPCSFSLRSSLQQGDGFANGFKTFFSDVRFSWDASFFVKCFSLL